MQKKNWEEKAKNITKTKGRKTCQRKNKKGQGWEKKANELYQKY